VRKTLIIAAFLVVVATSSAQTGLLDLRFGQNYDQLEQQLGSSGWLKQTINGSTVEFVPKKSKQVRGLTLYVEPNEKKLVGWMVAFYAKPKTNLWEGVVNKLKSMHGKDEYLQNVDAHVWDLGLSKQVISYPDKKSGYYCVLYIDSRYENMF
jgi:hypothetical protein